MHINRIPHILIHIQLIYKLCCRYVVKSIRIQCACVRVCVVSQCCSRWLWMSKPAQKYCVPYEDGKSKPLSWKRFPLVRFFSTSLSSSLSLSVFPSLFGGPLFSMFLNYVVVRRGCHHRRQLPFTRLLQF